MKTLARLLVVAFCGLSLNLLAADTAPAKKQPSAQVEALANTLTPPQRSRLLAMLNEADGLQLQGLPGIGETRAAAIQKARPFADLTDVVKVEGIGAGTFAGMVAHARAGFPLDAKRPPSRKKSPLKADPK